MKYIEIVEKTSPWDNRPIYDGGGKKIYNVLLNGTKDGELWYNMGGYVGTLPLPDGKYLNIGERSITEYKKAAARWNRVWKTFKR